MVKRKFKRLFVRVLSAVLTVGMLFTYAPTYAFAAEVEETVVASNEAPTNEEQPTKEAESLSAFEESASAESVVVEPSVEVVPAAPQEPEPANEEVAPAAPAEQEPANEEVAPAAPAEQEPANEEVEPSSPGEIEPTDEETEPAEGEEEIVSDENQEEVISDDEESDESKPAVEEAKEEDEEISSEKVVEPVVKERPRMLTKSMAPPPNPDPDPDGGNDPDTDPAEIYPNSPEMQEYYRQYGDQFKDDTDALIDDPNLDNFVKVENNFGEANNPELIAGDDENHQQINKIVKFEVGDKDGDGEIEHEYYTYEQDPDTKDIKITQYEEKIVEGLTDERIEDESKIDEIIAKYGENRTDVKKYYDEVPKEIIQPKNGSNHVNMFPTNQNGVKFEEPITTTDSQGNLVYLYNYKFTLGGETATVEQGNLRWDTTKKRDYGDKGYGCWIFIDENNKEWNLTNMSTTSTGGKNIKAEPYSEGYMNSLDKDLMKWFVESSDKNGQGNSYQYGDTETVFSHAIVNAEGWNYFQAINTKTLTKSKPKDAPPDDPDPVDPDPVDPDPVDPDPVDPDPVDPDPVDPDPVDPDPVDPDPVDPDPVDPDPVDPDPVDPDPVDPDPVDPDPVDPDPVDPDPVDPDPVDPDPVDPDPVDPDPGDPNPGPNPLPIIPIPQGIGEPVQIQETPVVIDNPVQKTVYLVVVDDNIIYSQNQMALITNLLDGVALVKNSEFIFVQASEIEKANLYGFDSVITISALRSESKLSPAIKRILDVRGNSVIFLNLWFFDDAALIDDGMENKGVDALEGNAIRRGLYVNSGSVYGTAISSYLVNAGSEFVMTGTVSPETVANVLVN